MRRPLNTAIGTACLTLLASLAFTPSLYPQDEPGKSKQLEKKAGESRRVDVQVKVSTPDKKPLPSGTTVEISGQETACGNLNSNDAHETVNENGEARFQNLPACKVSVKINLTQYMPLRKLIDLTTYKSCSPAAPAAGKGETGPAPPGCDPVPLELEPLR